MGELLDEIGAPGKATMNGHGSKREGAGYPKGVKWPSTLRKEEARELVRRYVTERLGQYLDAMSDNIVGIAI